MALRQMSSQAYNYLDTVCSNVMLCTITNSTYMQLKVDLSAQMYCLSCIRTVAVLFMFVAMTQRHTHNTRHSQVTLEMNYNTVTM